jgi:hypothetical protein
MIIPRSKLYFGLFVVYFIGIIVMIAMQAKFDQDISDILIVFIIIFLILLWQLLPPYKHYEFKMETLTLIENESESIYIHCGIFSVYKITPIAIDQKKGLTLKIEKIVDLLDEKGSTKSLGQFDLLPTSSDNMLSKASGKLNILCVSEKPTHEKYIEKIKYGSVGIMLRLAVKDKDKYKILVDTIKKNPSGLGILFKPMNL